MSVSPESTGRLAAKVWTLRAGQDAPPGMRKSAEFLSLPCGGLTLFSETGYEGPLVARSATGAFVVFDGALHEPEPGISDAESVLTAFEEQGESSFKRLRGFFDFVLWDPRKSRFLACRDPIGIQPLFWCRGDAGLEFSNSASGLTRTAPDPVVLAASLCHAAVKPDETFVQGVSRVRPGHFASFGQGVAVETYRYWDPHPIDRDIEWLTDEEMLDFERVFARAVNRCTRFGRPGLFLSGGIDSILVALFAAERCDGRGQGFPLALSLAFSDSECDEQAMQREVARLLGIPQVLLRFEDAVGERGLLPSALDVSRSLPSAPCVNLWGPAYRVLAGVGRAQGCEIVLTGGGGDEWLGVGSNFAADLIAAADIRGLVNLCRANLNSYRLPLVPALRSLLWTHGLRLVLGRSVRRALHRTAPRLLKARHAFRARRAVPEGLLPDQSLRSALVDRALAHADGQRGVSFYVEQTAQTHDHPLVSTEFEELFETARVTGLRVLEPFWDADLIGFLARVPPPVLNEGHRSKAVARSLLARRLPEIGIGTQKKVLAVRFAGNLIRREVPEVLSQVGRFEALSGLGVVDGKRFRTLISERLAMKSDRFIHDLWGMVSAEAWAAARITREKTP